LSSATAKFIDASTSALREFTANPTSNQMYVVNDYLTGSFLYDQVTYSVQKTNLNEVRYPIYDITYNNAYRSFKTDGFLGIGPYTSSLCELPQYNYLNWLKSEYLIDHNTVSIYISPDLGNSSLI
jgi:hypothetical protein